MVAGHLFVLFRPNILPQTFGVPPKLTKKEMRYVAYFFFECLNLQYLQVHFEWSDINHFQLLLLINLFIFIYFQTTTKKTAKKAVNMKPICGIITRSKTAKARSVKNVLFAEQIAQCRRSLFSSNEDLDKP